MLSHITQKLLVLLLTCLPLFARAHGDEPGRLLFEENKHQYPSSVQYVTDIPGGRLFVEKGQFRYAYHSTQQLDYIHNVLGHEQNLGSAEISGQMVHFHAIFVNFLGNSAGQTFEPGERESFRRNYFKGSDPSKWSSDVSVYHSLNVRGLYPGIDLSLYSAGPNLKYDLYVAPDTDPSMIRMEYQGMNSLEIKDGTLLLKTSVNEVTELAPVAYQVIGGEKVPVSCRYKLTGNIVSFEFPEGYNAAYTLVIDPVLVAATYSGSTSTVYGHSATYDNAGNVYAGGRSFGAGYPTTPGAYDGSFGGVVDISISKYNPNGTTLQYATYVGGTNDDYVHSMIVNNAGELFIMGSSSSGDFPTTAGAIQTAFGGGYDIVIAKLNPTGSTLMGSTYLGGTSTDGQNAIAQNYGDIYRGEIDLDGSGNILIANFSQSSDFPVTAGAYDATHNGGQDGVLCKLNPNLTGMIFSTFIGGSGDDATYEVSETSLGDLLICGGTSSSDFPTTAGAFQTSYQGGTYDGWVARISNSGGALVVSSYYGTPNYEQVFFTDIDNQDNVYVYGQSDVAMGTSGTVYSQAGGTMFLAMLNTACSSVTWKTVIGPSAGGHTPTAFLVDQCRKIYMSGWGGTTGLPVSAGAIQSSTDGSDFYLLVLQEDAGSLLYATYMGDGTAWEHVDGGTSRFDKQGIVYEAVCEGGSTFPTTPGAYASTSTVGWDIVVFKIDFEQQGVIANASALPNSVGCAPFTVNFDNVSLNAQSYYWDFDDSNSTSTQFEPSHTFNSPGTYHVMLIAIDSTTCNISDTTYLTIQVGAGDSVRADFDYILANCGTYHLVTDNQSFGAQDFQWDFGDGNTGSGENPTHDYATAGPWTVTLIATDTVCIGADTIQVQIQFGPPVLPVADFTFVQSPDCETIIANFTNTSQNSTAWLWDFGDGNTSTLKNPSHTYTNAGTYTITLTATDTICNTDDVIQQNITLDGGLVIDIGDDGEICPGQPVLLNAGPGADAYLWSTGDTTQTITVNNQGMYIVEVTDGNCIDQDTIYLSELLFNPGPDTVLVCPEPEKLHAGTGSNFIWSTGATTESITVSDEVTVWYEKTVGYCQVKDTIVVRFRYRSPDVYIPNTFTPNNDGLNEVFHVVGADKEDYLFLIYNRWGELLFSTNSPSVGWNGMYGGSNELVPQGTYVWKVFYTNYCNTPHEQVKIGHVNVLR